MPRPRLALPIRGHVILRPYQTAARDAVYRSWVDHRSTLLVLATGAGKTVVAGAVLRERASHGRILWLAHRTELLQQAADTLRNRMGLECELEKAESRAIKMLCLGGAPGVVGSVQTLRGKRLSGWDRDAFDTIVFDEAHHATAQGNRKILEHFPRAKVLGLTATPDRGDKVGLGAVFDDVAYEYGLRDAIRDGWLVPIVHTTFQVDDIDLRDVRTVAGDLSQSQLASKLESTKVHLQIAEPTIAESGDRPTLVFCVSVRQAEGLAAVFHHDCGVPAAYICGKTPPDIRAERLAAFRRGDLRVLVNVGVLTEGTDLPLVSCIAVARPTKSRALYAQIIGRGSRATVDLSEGRTAEERQMLIAHSEKPDCRVLDFAGNAGKHRLVNPLDVLAGRPLPDDIERRARQLSAEGKPSADALQQAEDEAAERERRDDDRRAREAKMRARVAYRKRLVDPFGVIRHDARDDGPTITTAQASYLRHFGVDVQKLAPTKREAGELIGALKARRAKNLCTYKQARVLARSGLRTDLSFDDARRAIDALAANGWRCIPSIRDRWGASDDD